MPKIQEITSIQPRPDEDILKAIVRLKNHPDFQAFRETLIRGRSGVLAYLSCSPNFTKRQSNYIQGRVHELSDLEKMIDEANEVLVEVQKTREAEGGK